MITINQQWLNRGILIYLLLGTCIGTLNFVFAEDETTPTSSFDTVLPFTSKGDFTLPAELENQFGDYRKNWSRLTGYEFSGLHWNNFIVIYINQEPDVYTYNYQEFAKHYTDEGDDDWDDEEDDDEVNFKEYSVGTAFLKEHFVSKDGRPAEGSLMTAMIKREKGYDPNFGDWQYYWVTATGHIIMKGKSDNKSLFSSCIECHSNMADRDYVFSTFSRFSYEEE